MNTAWYIPSGGANAVFDGANFSQIKTYVVFTSPTNDNGNFGILTLSGYPVSISSVSNSLVYAQSNTTVYININTSKSAEESIWVRYTTNSWASSFIVQASGSGTSYTAQIPGMKGGTSVEYYALTTTATSNNLANQPDLLTISINNNNNSNYSYSVPFETWHTINIDGVNDFYSNEVILTTSAGYTNYLTWDDSYFYIGYYGADISSGSADKLLVVYFSTNTNTGTAYSVTYNNQKPVLPFKADFAFNFIANYTWDSARWDGSSWVWDSPLTVVNNTDLKTNGNYLEFRISKSDLGNTLYLDVYLQFVNKAGGFEWSYGAIPDNTFTDGYQSNPSNFISFAGDIWKVGKKPSQTTYETNDPVVPYTNQLIYPTNGQLLFSSRPISMTNYADDNIGIYKVEFYTNTGGLYSTVYATNSNTSFISSIPANTFPNGSYQFYTIAYDTLNKLVSSSNQITITNNDPPPAPTLTIPANGDNLFYLRKPRFKWTIGADPNGDSITNFRIICADNSALANPLFDYTFVSTNNSFLTPFTNYLQNDSNYYWSVQASDGDLWGDWSTTNTFKVNPQYIRLDADLSDWGSTTYVSSNSDQVSNKQWMWNDATNDARNEPEATPYRHLDLLEFRVTADTNVLNFLFTVPDLSDDPTNDSPRTYISIALDTNFDGTGNLDLTESECSVNPNAKWEIEIVANVDGTGFFYVTGSNTNWYEWGENWITHTADPGFGEIAIGWDELGFSSVPNHLRMTISVGRVQDGLGNYHIQEITGSVDYVDGVSTNATAADEFSDGTNDVYVDIYFDTDGQVIESYFEVIAPSNAIAGEAFPVVVKAKAPLGGKVLDFNRAIIADAFSGGDVYILSNTGWVSGESTNYVILNYMGSNKVVIKDQEFTNITGTSDWIVFARPKVVINEVGIDPQGTDNNGEFIELYNLEAETVYLRGWSIHDHDADFPRFALPGNVGLPSSNFLVLIDGVGIDDTDFSDGRGTLYYDWGSNVFDSFDEVGLYNSATSESVCTIVDFVAWGANVSTDDDIAVAAGLWTDGDFASTNNLSDGSSIIQLPDGNDNNHGTDWSVDHSPTPNYGNRYIIANNLVLVTNSDNGYRDTILLAFEVTLVDPENDRLTNGDDLSNLTIALGGTITTNSIVEATLWNDFGAGIFNYGYRNSSATNNLLMGVGVYSNSDNAYHFFNLSNNTITHSATGGKMKVYFSLKLATNATVGETVNPYIPKDGILMKSTGDTPTGPKDSPVSNDQAQIIQGGRLLVYEYTDAKWAGDNDFKYQFVEVYNNSLSNVTVSGWNISTVQGDDNLSYFRGSNFCAGEFLLITPGIAEATIFTNHYDENTNASILACDTGSKFGSYGFSNNDTPFILREGTTILAIIDYTNSISAATNTVEMIDPYGGSGSGNYEASSLINGTPGFLNGFRASEMKLVNVSNYSLDLYSTNNLVLDFYIPNLNGQPDLLNMITIRNNGTAVDTDISFKLWSDGNSAGFDGDEDYLGAFSYSGSSVWSWSGSTPITNIGGVKSWRFFVTADVSNSVVDGRMVQMEVQQIAPANPAPYNGNFTAGAIVNSFNDGPVDYAVRNLSTQICGIPYLTLAKTVEKIEGNTTNLPQPGALVTYRLEYSNLSNGGAHNVIIFDRVPNNTTYYTNYIGTATGWTVEYAHIANPDQSYNSADYDNVESNVVWIRWRKQVVYSDEDNRTLFFGVTIN